MEWKKTARFSGTLLKRFRREGFYNTFDEFLQLDFQSQFIAPGVIDGIFGDQEEILF